MPEAKQLHLRRMIDAPPERVFRAWTDPEELRAWWGPGGFTTPEARIDLRVGGEYLVVMQPPGDGPPFRLAGTYLEIDPPTRLVYTWRWEPQTTELGGETTVTVEFVDRDGRTEVVVQHGPFADKVEEGPYELGWIGALDGLEGHFRSSPPGAALTARER